MTGNTNPMAANRVRVCQCGCATKLDKQKAHGRYLNVAHRQRAYRARKIADGGK